MLPLDGVCFLKLYPSVMYSLQLPFIDTGTLGKSVEMPKVINNVLLMEYIAKEQRAGIVHIWLSDYNKVSVT